MSKEISFELTSFVKFLESLQGNNQYFLRTQGHDAVICEKVETKAAQPILEGSILHEKPVPIPCLDEIGNELFCERCGHAKNNCWNNEPCKSCKTQLLQPTNFALGGEPK